MRKAKRAPGESSAERETPPPAPTSQMPATTIAMPSAAPRGDALAEQRHRGQRDEGRRRAGDRVHEREIAVLEGARHPVEVEAVEECGPRQQPPDRRGHLRPDDEGREREQDAEGREQLEQVEGERIAAALDREAPPRVEQRRGEHERELVEASREAGGGLHRTNLRGFRARGPRKAASAALRHAAA